MNCLSQQPSSAQTACFKDDPETRIRRRWWKDDATNLVVEMIFGSREINVHATVIEVLRGTLCTVGTIQYAQCTVPWRMFNVVLYPMYPYGLQYFIALFCDSTWVNNYHSKKLRLRNAVHLKINLKAFYVDRIICSHTSQIFR